MTPTRERSSAPITDTDAPDLPDQSAFGTRGVAWWAAVLVAGLPTAVATLVDILVSGKIGVASNACYVAGCLVAIVLVQRRSVYPAMLQPPLVMAVVMPVFALLVGSGSGSGQSTTARAFSAVAPMITNFPIMGITSAIVLIAGLLRMFMFQRIDDLDSDEEVSYARVPAGSAAAARQAAPDSGAARRPAQGASGRPGRTTNRGATDRQRSGDARERGNRAVPPTRGARQTPPGRSGRPARQPGGEPPRRPRRPPREDFWD